MGFITSEHLIGQWPSIQQLSLLAVVFSDLLRCVGTNLGEASPHCCKDTIFFLIFYQNLGVTRGFSPCNEYVKVCTFHQRVCVVYFTNIRGEGLRLLPRPALHPAATNNLSHMFKNFPSDLGDESKKGLSSVDNFLCLSCDEGHIKSVSSFHIEEMIFISWAGLKGNSTQAVLRFNPVMNFLIQISLL